MNTVLDRPLTMVKVMIAEGYNIADDSRKAIHQSPATPPSKHTPSVEYALPFWLVFHVKH